MTDRQKRKLSWIIAAFITNICFITLVTICCQKGIEGIFISIAFIISIVMFFIAGFGVTCVFKEIIYNLLNQ